MLFFILACAFSWLNWGLVIASAQGWVDFKFGHQSINMSTYLLPELLPTIEASHTYQYIFIAATILAAGVAIVDMARRAPSLTRESIP